MSAGRLRIFDAEASGTRRVIRALDEILQKAEQNITQAREVLGELEEAEAERQRREREAKTEQT